MKEKLKDLGKQYIEEICLGNYTIVDKIQTSIYATLDCTGDEISFTIDPEDKYVYLDANIFMPNIIDNYIALNKEEVSRIIASYLNKVEHNRKAILQEELRQAEETVKELTKKLKN